MAELPAAAIRLMAERGLSAIDIAEIAEMVSGPKKRNSNAERQARWRARNRPQSDGECVTSDVTNNALPPPIDNNHTPPVSSNDETTRQPKARKNPSTQAPAKPADVSDQVWGDFLRHRKAKRADVNDTVVAGIRRECATAGWTLEAALAETVTRGWQSFKADWVDKPVAAQNDDFMAHMARKSQGVPSG